MVTETSSLRNENPNKLPPLEPGMRFGFWELVGFVEKTKHWDHVWLCRCSCGLEAKRNMRWLRRQPPVDCPHVPGMAGLSTGPKRRRHTDMTWLVWKGMRMRCESPRRKDYKRYGARGIAVCDRWKSYKNFLEDMGPRPSKAYSIERINYDGNYEPGNCCWILRSEQGNNTSRSVRIEHNGETLTLQQWAGKIGISHRTLHGRLFVLKWSVDEALTKPVWRGGPRKPVSRHAKAA